MNNLSITPSIRPPQPDVENHIVMWMEKYGRQLQATRNMPDCKLLFVGDSITEHWPLEGYAPELWNQYYSHHKVINAGSGGDCTENILWRLQNGLLDHIAPRLVVLMAGTNNTGRRMDTPMEIRNGVRAIIECIHAHSPSSQILLHAIFPRGRDSSDPMRLNNEAANRLLESVAESDSRIEFIDINAVFLADDGMLSEDIMPDLLHPGAEGYRLWAEAIDDWIKACLDA